MMAAENTGNTSLPFNKTQRDDDEPGSPGVTKLHVDATVVFDALGVFEIHDHSLRGFEDKVHARPDGRIDAAVEWAWRLSI